MAYQILYIVPFGLEDVANYQINGKVKGRGLITKKYFELETGLKDVYFLRVHYRALLIISGFIAKSIQEIEIRLREVNWHNWIPFGSFACRCSRRGTHSFKSTDIERLCGSVILEKTNHLMVNLTKPDTIVRIIIENDEVFVGLDLVGYDSMHKRGYRIFNHPSALNPVLAYHLVLLGGQFKSLLDPTCGGGTILIEACHHMLNIPAGWFRKEKLAIISLPYIKERIDAKRVIYDTSPNFQSCDEIFFVGIDNSPKALEGARCNIENARCSKYIHLIHSDIVMQPVSFDRGFDTIIANPPYGIRIGSPRKALKVHKAIAKLAKELLTAGGKLVVITPHLHVISGVLKSSPSKHFKTFSGDLPVEIGVFEV